MTKEKAGWPYHLTQSFALNIILIFLDQREVTSFQAISKLFYSRAVARSLHHWRYAQRLFCFTQYHSNEVLRYCSIDSRCEMLQNVVNFNFIEHKTIQIESHLYAFNHTPLSVTKYVNIASFNS